MQDNTWRKALQKTRQATLGRIAHLLGSSEITDDFWTELEAVLIQADVGLPKTLKLLELAQATARKEGYTRGEQVQTALIE